MHEITLVKNQFPSVLECNFLVCHAPFVHADRTVPFNVLIYVTAGQITVTEDGTDYVIRAGELFFLKCGVHHYGKKLIKTGTSWYYIHFVLQECKSEKTDFLTIPKKTAGLAHTEIENSLKEFTEQYICRAPSFKWKSGALLFSMLCDAVFYPQHMSTQKSVLAERLSEYLREHVSEPFDSYVLENEFNLTGKYLELVFKREKHIPLQKYHTDLKIAEACRLLRTTLFSVKEISGKLGYSDMLYFSRTFHKACGMSPISYRKQIETNY
jgi:AraC family transcriptional regulator, arabinose operon regulatory protein